MFYFRIPTMYCIQDWMFLYYLYERHEIWVLIFALQCQPYSCNFENPSNFEASTPVPSSVAATLEQKKNTETSYPLPPPSPMFTLPRAKKKPDLDPSCHHSARKLDVVFILKDVSTAFEGQFVSLPRESKRKKSMHTKTPQPAMLLFYSLSYVIYQEVYSMKGPCPRKFLHRALRRASQQSRALVVDPSPIIDIWLLALI